MNSIKLTAMTLGLIAAGAFAAFWGLRLMNPKYYDEIMEIWDRKWNKKEAAETADGSLSVDQIN